MVENKIKIINQLNAEIKELEEEIDICKKYNDILKLNIQKKELLLQKLTLEEADK